MTKEGCKWINLHESIKSRCRDDLPGSSLNWALWGFTEASVTIPTDHEHLSSGFYSCTVSLRPSFHIFLPSTEISKYFGHTFFVCLFVFNIFLMLNRKIYENRITLTHLTLFPKCLVKCLAYISHESNRCVVNLDDDQRVMVIQEKVHV